MSSAVLRQLNSLLLYGHLEITDWFRTIIYSPSLLLLVLACGYLVVVVVVVVAAAAVVIIIIIIIIVILFMNICIIPKGKLRNIYTF